MVRAFLETLFVCSKSAPKRDSTSKKPADENGRVHPHAERSGSQRFRTIPHKQPTTGVPQDDLFSLRAILNQALNTSKHQSKLKTVCLSETQIASNLVTDIRNARSRLVDCQALDKWISNWQENEFRRSESKRGKLIQHQSGSTTQLDKSRRTHRRSAQGRALSDRALLSAKYSKRRDELIRKALETVRPSVASQTEIQRHKQMNEIWEPLSTDLPELDHGQCASEFAETTLFSPLSADMTTPREAVALNSFRARSTESHTAQTKIDKTEWDRSLSCHIQYSQHELYTPSQAKMTIEGTRSWNTIPRNTDKRLVYSNRQPGKLRGSYYECGDWLSDVFPSIKLVQKSSKLGAEEPPTQLADRHKPSRESDSEEHGIPRPPKSISNQQSTNQNVHNFIPRIVSKQPGIESKQNKRMNRFIVSKSTKNSNKTMSIVNLSKESTKVTPMNSTLSTSSVGHGSSTGSGTKPNRLRHRYMPLHSQIMQRVQRLTCKQPDLLLSPTRPHRFPTRSSPTYPRQKNGKTRAESDQLWSLKSVVHKHTTNQHNPSKTETFINNLLRHSSERYSSSLTTSQSSSTGTEKGFPIPELWLPNDDNCQISFQFDGRNPVSLSPICNTSINKSPSEKCTHRRSSRHLTENIHRQMGDTTNSERSHHNKNDNSFNTNNNYTNSFNERKREAPTSVAEQSYVSNTHVKRRNDNGQTRTTRSFKNDRLRLKLFRQIFGKSQLHSQFLSRGSQSHNQEPSLPMLRLEDLKSYTLTSSTTSHVCDGKAKPEDQTSDTFVLSAASEFLHSTSDEQFAFKHRPRPGIATGRQRQISPSSEQRTPAGLESKADGASAEKLDEPPQNKKVSEIYENEEIADVNETISKGSMRSNFTEPPGSEMDLEMQYIPMNEEIHLQNQSFVQSEPPRGFVKEPLDSIVQPKHPHKSTFFHKTSRRKLKRPERVEPNRKGRQKNNFKRPPWNFSTRNLATQFYAIQPIESILWPEGRIPRTDEGNKRVGLRRARLRGKYHSLDKVVIRPRHKRSHSLQAIQQQSNADSPTLAHHQRFIDPKTGWRRCYRRLFPRELIKLNKLFPNKKKLHKDQSKKTENYRHPEVNQPAGNSLNDRVCGDSSSTAFSVHGLRRSLHLTSNLGKGDQLRKKTEKHPCSGRKLRSKPPLTRNLKLGIRFGQSVQEKPITTRQVIGKPRLWSAVHPKQRFHSSTGRAKPAEVITCSHSSLASTKNPSTITRSPGSVKATRNKQNKARWFPKFRRRANSRRVRTQGQSSRNNIYYDTHMNEGNKSEPTRKIDFFAYVAIVPSEIDELVLPFRACNRLRTCLKNIEDLMTRLETEVTEMGQHNTNTTSSRKRMKRKDHSYPVNDTGEAFMSSDQNSQEQKTIPRREKFLDRLRRKFVHTTTTSIASAPPDSLIVNNNAQSKEASVFKQATPSQRSTVTAHSDTILLAQLDPKRVQFWNDVLQDCEDVRLSKLLEEMHSITDRRIFAIEQRTRTRIRLNETVVYTVHGLPCMELRILAYEVTDIQRALVQLEMCFPRLYRQILFTERFYGSAAPGLAHRFPTTNEFFFTMNESTAAGQPSVSTVRRVIPVIEEARKLKRSHKSFG